MSNDIRTLYPGRVNPANADYPFGSIKNESVPGTNDGTPLTAEWGNDFEALKQGALKEAGATPSGTTDTAESSQVLNALKDDTATVADIADGRYPVGRRVIVTDRDGAEFIIQSGGTANGFDILPAGTSKTATLIYPAGGYFFGEWLGLKTDGTNAATNNNVLARARDLMLASDKSMFIGEGDIAYTVSPDWRINGLRIKGAGPDKTIFRYGGSATAFSNGVSAVGQGFRYAQHLEGFSVDGGDSATTVMDFGNVAHGNYKHVLAWGGVGLVWSLKLNVLNHFDTCGVPLDRKPAAGWVEALTLNASPDGASTTACTFTNFIAEGASLAGIRLLAADNNTFNGGTSESNTGRGVLVAPSVCRDNTFNGLDMEDNTGEDFLDNGISTRWNNCLATSPLGGVIGDESIACKIDGGTYDKISILTGAKAPVTVDLTYNVKGTGAFVNGAGESLVYRNLYDATLSSFTNLIADRIGLSVGTSPWTYVNDTGIYQSIVINGGTITGITVTRNGNTFSVPSVSPSYTLLAPGDVLETTYSVTPTLAWRLPQNNMRG